MTPAEINEKRSTLRVLVLKELPIREKLDLQKIDALLEIALQLACLNVHLAAVEAAKTTHYNIPGVDGVPANKS